MVHYLDKKSAKVALSYELIERGWKIYGFKEDQSDMMTDYYSPASWDGIAEKNGFVLVIDQYSTHYSGYEVKKYDYSKTRSTSSKVEKLQATVNDKAATPAEKETAQQLIDKLNAKGNTPDYEVLEVYPIFSHKTPKSCIWHIEKDGQIIAKGKGLYSLYSINDREGTKQNMKKFADKLEQHVNDDTQLVPIQKEFKTKVTKVIESDSSKLEIGKTLLKLNCGFTGGHSKGNVFILSSEYDLKLGKRINLTRLGKKYQVLKVTEKNCLTLAYDNLLEWIKDGSISIVELKEVEEVEIKTVYVKAKRQQKATSTDVRLETSVNSKDQEIIPETIENVASEVVEASSNVNYKLNEEKQGVEIYFDSIPSEEIRNQLKTNGFRWSRFSKCWYAKQSEKTLQLAEQLASGQTEEVEQTEIELLDIDPIEQYKFSLETEQRLIDNSLINRRKAGDYTKRLHEDFNIEKDEVLQVMEYANNNYDRNKVIKLFNSYMKRYFEAYNNYLYSSSISPSWAVTGRGNINARNYNKKQERVHNKLGKTVEIYDKFKSDLSNLKNEFKKQSIKQQQEIIQEAINNQDITITFSTRKREIEYYGYKYNTRSYEGEKHFMMKLAGCYRIFERTTGKEVHSMKTNAKLDEAKSYLFYLDTKQGQAV